MAAADDFVNFESAQVHPVALSADASRLFAVNTPDGRLSMFDVAPDGSLTLSGEFPVGIDPVSLAVRGNEVWVVNHISDSISVVDASLGKLVATIQTGDEPTDIVFANGRAFVSMAGARDQVKIYDAASRAEIGQLDIFGDDPRALAASADGSEVYLVVLESGNRTSSIAASRVVDPPPPPSPPMATALPPAPKTALIVQFNPATERWEDETGQARGDSSDLDVPDEDVFVIDTTSLAVVRTARSVGTSLFDVAVQPGTGKLWVSNTDARNLVRFEPNLRGHFIDTRLTAVEVATGDRVHHDLNPHVDYGVSPGPPAEIAQSVAIPGDIAFTGDGSTGYVTGFGSSNVAVFDATGAVVGRIAVGGGPSGLALAEAIDRLYVVNRFDNTISIVDTVSRQQVSSIGLSGASRFDPSPEVIRNGRPFLYDATRTSGHGDSACASCHVFGNFDGIGWDLGDPTGLYLRYVNVDWVTFTSGPPLRSGIHPMKGPMVTQTLRGLAGLEPFHWRGDKRNFQHFNGAFVSLMGLDDPLPDSEMDLFADFAMTIRMPPNPNRTLDDALPPTIRVMAPDGFGSFVDANPVNGEDIYFHRSDENGRRRCVTCHTMPDGTDRSLNSSILVPQDMKISQLRNGYEKVAFGRVLVGEYGNIGAQRQKSGFGVLHGGSESLAEFLIGYFANQDVTLQQQEDLTAFLMAFPSGTPPVIGHQVTLDHVNARSPTADAEIALLAGQAALGNCDLVVQGVVGGQAKSFLYDVGADAFVPDSREEAPIGDVALRSSLVDGDVITYTAVPAGSGRRIGIDRDRDTWLDADEALQGTSASNVDSVPMECEGGVVDSVARPRLKLPVGGEGVVLARGEVDLSANLSPDADPGETGMILDIRDTAGNVVLRRWIPPGALQPRRQGGWRFRSARGAGVAGIERADVSLQDGRFQFTIRGRVAGVALAGPQFPITMIVVFGTAEQDAADQCGKIEFASDDCRTKPRSVDCR